MAKLYFYYASMNAGKSTTLLQADFNYRERGLRTLLFTAAVDDRVAAGRISSRIGLWRDARCFDAETDLLAVAETEMDRNGLHCVLVDEAQFLRRRQVEQLCTLADRRDVPVLAYGLRTDFRGELFEGAQWLLALADVLAELKAVCGCGRKATMNLRHDAAGRVAHAGAQMEIGGNDRYLAVCRRHFTESRRGGWVPDFARGAGPD
jgi:thymidine kinase